MTEGAKAVGYAIGGLAVVAGLVLQTTLGAGIGLIVLGAAIIAGIALEPRYRRLSGRGGANWQPTGERFIDDETGDAIEVWYDPASGQREYRSREQQPPA